MTQLKPLIFKELSHFFNSATVWIFTVVFLGINNFFYFTNFFLAGQATMRPFFENFPLTLIFFTTLLAMNTLSGEKKSGTLEILLSLPLKKSSIILAKFIALLLVITFSFIFTLPTVLILLLLGSPDLGPIFTSYLGTLFLVSVYGSVGIFFSVLFAEQLIAFLLSASLLFCFYILGTDLVLERVPTILQTIFQVISPANHYLNFVRGVIYPKDLIYFISLSFLFLYIAFKNLNFEKK